MTPVSPELRRKIADNIRAYEGRAVSWFDLVTKYKLPQSQLEEIFAYDEAERLKRQELSAKVTSVAQQTYHNGRCDWEAVAQEFAMPLLECLELYDAAQSSISPRLFPKLVDWPDGELQLLRQFVNMHFEDMTANEWKLVGIYMNVNQTDYDMDRVKRLKQRAKRLKTSAEYTEVVSRAVREQYHKHKRVDWEQISTAVGLSQRECLEANEFNEGKARWEYDPETLSQEMADRMTQFIETTYPYPVPVNYQAVSNYMWIDKADCYKMAKQLDGDIEWTQELKERVVALRKQGMTYRSLFLPTIKQK
ncbi:hypothetical protein EV183_001558 [Coemansia sp. RSA 2336]|nr:hypothetical protein EV183_001558 [Coemansia sp. RSA 2336]